MAQISPDAAAMDRAGDSPPEGSIGAKVATGGGCCKAPAVDWSALTEQDKKALLNQLVAYDMTDLDVYVLKQIA